MSKAQFSTKAKKYKIGMPHIVVWGAMVVAFFLLFQFKLIPVGISQFVVKLFEPSGDQREKIGFVKFEGLVWASTSLDNEAKLQGKQVEISRELINREYIFDFT
ncbi:MAG TPA: hypothetical protein PLV01_08995, partial [Candidatus Kapabacteria bacterium]|nr:hypothetical protein [Candidatus Kapabacteria bacterium]